MEVAHAASEIPVVILFVRNDPPVTAGTFAPLLAARGVPFATWDAAAGAPPPSLEGISGTIVLGGTMGVHQRETFPGLAKVLALMEALLAQDLPQLDICLGGQLLAHLLGGAVRSGSRGERGCCTVELTAAGRKDPLLAGLSSPFPVLQWHDDSFDLPAGAGHLAFSGSCPGQAFRYGRAWGVQFHPEADLELVARWTALCRADPRHLEGFRRSRHAVRRVGERMLLNFLGLCGLAQGDRSLFGGPDRLPERAKAQ